MIKDYLARLDNKSRTPEQNQRFYRSMLRLILLDGNSADERLIDYYLDLIKKENRETKP